VPVPTGVYRPTELKQLAVDVFLYAKKDAGQDEEDAKKETAQYASSFTYEFTDVIRCAVETDSELDDGASCDNDESVISSSRERSEDSASRFRSSRFISRKSSPQSMTGEDYTNDEKRHPEEEDYDVRSSTNSMSGDGAYHLTFNVRFARMFRSLKSAQVDVILNVLQVCLNRYGRQVGEQLMNGTTTLACILCREFSLALAPPHLDEVPLFDALTNDDLALAFGCDEITDTWSASQLEESTDKIRTLDTESSHKFLRPNDGRIFDGCDVLMVRRKQTAATVERSLEQALACGRPSHDMVHHFCVALCDNVLHDIVSI